MVQLLVQLGLPLFLLVGAYFTGTWVEAHSYRSIRRRESSLLAFPVLTIREAPQGWRIAEVGLVTGSVVVSVDYFKRFLAGLRAIFGGRIKAYEPLLDRARREAILRMKEQAMARGFDAVVNLRFETSRLASSTGQGRGVAGVELLAYGTSVKREP